MSVDKLGMTGLAGLSSMDALLPASTPRTDGDVQKQFQAVLVRQLLKQLPLGLEGGQAEMFSSMVYDALTEQLVSSGALDSGVPMSSPHVAPAKPAPVHVTSAFGLRHDPIDGTDREHRGVDLEAPLGAPILAVQDGTVTFAGRSGGYGNLVIVDHGDGLQTRYAHCDRLDVAVGQQVRAGEAIAAVGQTGRATGPHLHLEVRLDGEPTDPIPWLRRTGAKAIAEPIRGGEQRRTPAGRRP
ncbi:MAG: M23 family metallopeptidase [Myxococcota bacterium]